VREQKSNDHQLMILTRANYL